MRIITYITTFGLTLTLISCGQDYNRSEPYIESRELLPAIKSTKKDTFIVANKDNSIADPCNIDKYFKDPKTSKLAKDIYANRDWNLSNDTEALALLDSLTAKDQLSRPFYFKVVTKSEKKSDGYYSEGLGLSGKEYVEHNTIEFLNNFENNECFTDKDLEVWGDIVLLEFELAEDRMYDKPFVNDYIKILNKNCKNCSANQKSTLKKFSDNLKKKWADYIKKMRIENKE